MAAFTAMYEATATISIPVESEFLTSPQTPTNRKHQPVRLRRGRGTSRYGTAPEVDPHERGDEDERNRAEGKMTDRTSTTKEEVVSSDGEAVRVRSEVARDLIHRVDALLPLVGDVALATNIQLLKRDLPLMQSAIQEATKDGWVQTSIFIRMEYLRGVVLNLIELYFLVKESDSVSDALIDWSQKVNQERKLKIVLMNMHRWLLGHEDWQDKDKSMRRLGDLIVRLVFDFDRIFKDQVKDRRRCRLGRVHAPPSAGFPWRRGK